MISNSLHNISEQHLVIRSGVVSWIITFCLLLCVTGCDFVGSEREMRGQVFVLQKNGVTLKLSLVQIEFVDESEVTNRIAAKQKDALARVKEIRERIAKLDETLKPLETEKRLFLDDVAKQQALLKSMVETMLMILEARRDSGSSFMKKEADELELSIDSAKQKIEQATKLLRPVSNKASGLNSEKEELLKQITAISNPTIYFEDGWSKVLAKATTDADGKFVVKLPKKARLMIAAKTSREVGVSTEYYCWLLPVQGLDFKEVLLNNNNLVSPIKENGRQQTDRN